MIRLVHGKSTNGKVAGVGASVERSFGDELINHFKVLFLQVEDINGPEVIKLVAMLRVCRFGIGKSL